MTQLKRVGIYAGAALVILLAGYLWGWAGRRTAERALTRANARLELSDARRLALAGSVDLYKLNFGAAAAHFENARATADRARVVLADAGSTADPADLTASVTALDEARALAAKLDPAAGQKAAAAVGLLDKVAAAP